MEEHSNTELLVDQDFLLQKMQGKGGWTYAAIPQINQDKHAHFGVVKVRGAIDKYEISNFHLMPMGNGVLFLPVKAEIRKIIGKNEGDLVHITLYSQELPSVEPDDFIVCLKDEPIAFDNYHKLDEFEQKAIMDWIFSAKRDDQKLERIVQSIDKLLISF